MGEGSGVCQLGVAQGWLHMEEGHGRSPPRMFMSKLKQGVLCLCFIRNPFSQAFPGTQNKISPMIA